MTSAKSTKKKSPQMKASLVQNPNEMPQPNDLEGYVRRGWAFHSRSQEDKAEADFLRALSLDPESVDVQYALGLVYKAQGKKEQAIQAFKKTIALLDAGKVEDRARHEMLHRLSYGHVNELSTGDWNLEDQIWQRRS